MAGDDDENCVVPSPSTTPLRGSGVFTDLDSSLASGSLLRPRSRSLAADAAHGGSLLQLLLDGDEEEELADAQLAALVPGPSEPVTPRVSANVGIVGIAVMAFAVTAGAPFGSEPTVQAGGIFWSWLSFLVIPWLWAFPQILMSAELSLALPEDGGSVVWVRRAFGSLVGGVSAYNSLAWSFLIACQSVQIFTAYALPGANPVAWLTYTVTLAYVLAISVVNIAPMDWLGHLNTLLVVMMCVPFAIMAVWPFFNGDFRNAHVLIEPLPPGDVDWAVFFAFLIWSFGNYDLLGACAGENFSMFTFLGGCLLALLFTLVMMIGPFSMGFLMDSNRDDWVSGFYTDLCFQTATWMGWMMIVAASVFNAASSISMMMPLYRTIWSMAADKGARKVLPTPLAVTFPFPCSSHRVPIVAIVLVALAATAVVLFVPFTFLVQMSVYMRLVMVLLEYAALIWLRYREPDLPRPWRVPFGYVGVVSLMLPTVGITIFTVYSGDYFVELCTLALFVLYLVAYLFERAFAVLVWRRVRTAYRRWRGRGRDDNPYLLLN